MPREVSASVATEMTTRSVGILLRQTRAGACALAIVGALFGAVLVPAAGWGPFLAWYAVLLVALAGRQAYFVRLSARDGASERTFLRIATVTAITGWFPASSVPVFLDVLTLADVGVITVLVLGSLSAAVAVIGVHPRGYACYMVASLATLYVGWVWLGTPRLWGLIGAAMVVGGVMLQRAVWTNWQQLRENVEFAARNAQLVAQLREALDRQQDILSARSRFLGAASHDLRQPVQALLFLSDIFRRTGDVTQRDSIAKQIVRTGESIDTMFRHLVDFAQIDAGTMRASMQPVQIAWLVQGLVCGYAEKCAAKGLLFSLDLQTQASVRADPVLLERLMRNLLDNACKYSLGGAIVLSVREADGCLEIEVADQGVGMDADDLATVWRAFQRGRSASVAEAEGLGLGLAICRHVADLMAAQLQLVSAPGEGTRVTLRMPLLQRQPPQPASIAARSPALEGRLIAVVENDRLAREALAAWLQDAGAQVAAGGDLGQVRTALAQASASPDCLIADYRLAHGDGLDVIDALRAQHGPIPALLVSSEPGLQDRVSNIPCLQKPVSPEQLLELLQRLLPEACPGAA